MTAPTRLANADLRWCVRALGTPVRGFVESHPSLVIAGGFVRSCVSHEDATDIDIFAPSSAMARLCSEKLKDAHGEYSVTTPFAVTVVGSALRLPVQFVHRWAYATPIDILDTFDFTISQAAIYYDTAAADWAGICAPDFYRDLAGRRLVYTQPSENVVVGGSLLRACKFMRRGYHMPPPELAAMLAVLVGEQASQEDFRPGDRLRIAKSILGELRAVDPPIHPTLDEFMADDGGAA